MKGALKSFRNNIHFGKEFGDVNGSIFINSIPQK